MGEELRHRPVKLIVSVIYRDGQMLAKAQKSLTRMFGRAEALEMDVPFEYTDYYFEEFGDKLRRKLLCFVKPVGPEGLASVKLATNRLEGKLKRGSKRTVNIDPGYVTEAKLVLLTTKDYTHRVYIGRRIFAESTLYYRDGSFRAWPWTYPDYASADMIGYFNKVRVLYTGAKRS